MRFLAGGRKPARTRHARGVVVLLRALVAIVVFGALPAPALAASVGVSGTIRSGDLSLTTAAAPAFEVTLDGEDEAASYPVPTQITEASGDNAGWSAAITSTRFSTNGPDPRTLPQTASAISGVSSACGPNSTCTPPTNDVPYPVTVPAAAAPPPPVPYFRAAAGSGKGAFENTPTVGVTVPADADAGTYESTLTLSISRGP